MKSIDEEGKTVEEALEKALGKLNKTRDEVEYEVLDEGSQGILGVGARPILVRVRVKDLPEMQEVKDLVSKLLNCLDVAFADLDIDFAENNYIKIDIDTEEAGILIGKYGQTLESLQYLINQIMHESKYKFMLDVSNYREKHNNKLVETAKKFANIVRNKQRSISLKPMSAYDRRIIHETIKDFTDLTTKSIGVEPNRKVIIDLVNPPRRFNNKRSSGGGGYNRSGGGYNRSGGGYNRSGGGYNRGGGGGYNRSGGDSGNNYNRNRDYSRSPYQSQSYRNNYNESGPEPGNEA